mmetsp:Transcript_33960/g.33115  ORF Transcript_33960/g.33115 Transcript_33960/m.33115 type:complete len:155 (-) Transcript_33960:94-558(-)
MLFDLKIMGFEKDIALYALKSVQYHSKDRAVDFLMEVGPDGKHQHPFTGENCELCIICQKTKEFHILEDDLLFPGADDLGEGVDGHVVKAEPVPSTLEHKIHKFHYIREQALNLSQRLEASLKEEVKDDAPCAICYEPLDRQSLYGSFKFACGH